MPMQWRSLEVSGVLRRPKRPGEVEGVDYFFVSKEQFEEWIRSDELLEWALVYGEYKGIPKTQVLHLIAPLYIDLVSLCICLSFPRFGAHIQCHL